MVRFSIGQFFGPVALQVMSNTHPGEYLIPLYTQVRIRENFLSMLIISTLRSH